MSLRCTRADTYLHMEREVKTLRSQVQLLSEENARRKAHALLPGVDGVQERLRAEIEHVLVDREQKASQRCATAHDHAEAAVAAGTAPVGMTAEALASSTLTNAFNTVAVAGTAGVVSPVGNAIKNESLENTFTNQGLFIMGMAAKYELPPEQVMRDLYNDAHVERVDLDNNMTELVWHPRESSEIDPTLIARIPTDMLTPELSDNLDKTLRHFNDEAWWAQDWDFETAGLFEIDAPMAWLPGFRDAGLRAGREMNDLRDQLGELLSFPSS